MTMIQRVLIPGCALLCAAAATLLSPTWAATQPSEEQSARLARSKSSFSGALQAQVLNHQSKVSWIAASDRFWFKLEQRDGWQFVTVDAATGNRRPAFDHESMAAALSVALAKPVRATQLPIDELELDAAPSKVVVTVGDSEFVCELPQRKCNPQAPSALAMGDVIVSPDGRYAVLRRDNNLWLRDLHSNAERQLTRDGIENFGYGDLDAYMDELKVPRRRAGLPEPLQGVHWSPDSRRVLALRQDLRAVPARLVLTEYLPPEGNFPIEYPRRVAVAGDAQRANSAMTLIDVESGATQTVKLDPQAMNDWALPYFAFGAFVRWDAAGKSVFVLTATRGGGEYKLVRIDTATGNTEVVIAETGRYNVRLNPDDYALPNVYVTSDARQAIWYSERDGWGHLYLYDVASGKPLRQLTQGAWVVADLVRVDERSRQIYFTATGREPGRMPYYRHLYRVSMDGGTPQLLTPEDADHEFDTWRPFWEGPGSGSVFSPSGRYFVDSYSTATDPARVVIRKRGGELVRELVRADDSALRASGWRPPEQFVVKAADDVTDLYGVIYKPSNFNPALKYPVIEQTYPGPQGKFAPATFRGYFNYMHPQAFAELGFIVVYLDGRGTAYRSREFRDAFLGTEDPFGSADHAAALRHLALTRPYLDLARVGVHGQSFGGYGSLRAMLLHPDLFKVCVSSVGPGDWLHMPGDTSNERFFGVPTSSPAARAHFDSISNSRLAERMTGHLLLIYGGLDEVVPLHVAFGLVDALIRADKPFDLLVVPDSPHHAGAERYGVKRTMLYFMEYLGAPAER
jgi:dipeptidyl-peptidase 4